MKNQKIITIFTALVFIAVSISAQTGGNFKITESVIAGGGGQQSAGGTFSLDGTIGQPAAGGELSGGLFAVTSGFWNFSPSTPNVSPYEADVAPRPNGGGMIQANDVIQMLRFFNELDVPNITPNEFQRADSAPRSSSGDGMIISADVVQTLRYLNELDALQSADGPISPTGSLAEPFAGVESSADASAKTMTQRIGKTMAAAPTLAPELRVESTSGSAGSPVTVNIRVDAVGNESQYGFAVLFDPAVLSFNNFAAGETGATDFTCNTTATAGRVRCSIGGFPNNNPNSNNTVIKEINPGDNQLLIKVIFNVAANAVANSTTAIRLGSQSASDDSANSIIPATTDGTVTITGPTAAGAAVSGRVMTPTGRGLTNATVILTDAAGGTRTARTSAFGYYRFEEVAAGQTYILSVKSKRYQFDPQAVNVTEDLTELNFMAKY